MSQARRTPRLREVRLFVSGPPGAVLDRFEQALLRAGSFDVARGPWSIAAAPTVSPSASLLVVSPALPVVGNHSPGPGTLSAGGAHLALVPVQVFPTCLRAWLTWVPREFPPDDPIDTAVEAFTQSAAEASRTLQRNVEALERARDDEAAWQSQASNIREALTSTGVAPDDVEARVEVLRTRWARTHRRAALTNEDEPPAV